MAILEKVIANFKYERTLSHDTRTKLLHVLGKVDEKDCILTLEQAQYDSSDIPSLASHAGRLTGSEENGIYGWAEATIHTPSPNTRIKMIFPATDLHIRKYEHQERVLITETPEVYENVTRPYIDGLPEDRTQWVRNILNGTSEADRVLWRHTDPCHGFVILPDMKWDGTRDALYWVAIVANPTIHSLRSLTADHLELLKAIRNKANELAREKFELQENQLRLFVHYQPSYYHFHVHITAVSFSDAPGVMAGQAHLLDTIIDHLEHYPDYYAKATLPFVIGKGQPLYQKWVEFVQTPNQ